MDLDHVLDQVMLEIATLVKAEGASLLLLEPRGDELVFVASISPASERLIGARMPATAGIAGWAVEERQSVLLNNAQHDPRFYKDIDAITHLTTRSLIAVPLIVRNKVIGVIEVINKLDGTFDLSDLGLLQALGSSAAIAIENAQLFETTRHSEERYRHLFDNSPISIWELCHHPITQLCGHLLHISPVQTQFEQFADWTGSDPSSTGTAPRFSAVDDVPQRSCLSDHQTVW